MKHIFAIIVVLALAALLAFGLYTPFSDGLNFSPYGKANVNARVSGAYIDKSVNGANDGVTFGESAGLESGSANYVTSVIVNYRSFDTLGEVTVLFVSALGVGLLLSGKRKKQGNAFAPSFILKTGARLVFGIMVVFGVYMFSHGHITPGGGFPGGSIIAAAILLLYMADADFAAKVKALKATEGVAGSLYVILGLAGIAVGGYFLQNFLPTGVVGNVFSAGIIPVVYVLIGLKVGAELTGIIDSFITEEVDQ